MPVREQSVHTPFAEISLLDTGGEGLPVVLLHGNSNSREVFRHQLDSELVEHCRLIAIDLPGHGGSSDATDPERTYSIPGYAETVDAVVQALNIDQFALVGWSLGGHVALEMIPRNPAIVGVMIVGAPPVGRELAEIQRGFQETPALYLAGKEELTKDELRAFVDLTLGSLADAAILDGVKRSHGLARKLSFQALVEGRASDERRIVETTRVPIAVVNGQKDGIVDLTYVGGIHYRSLWNDHCYVLRNVGHAPFLEAPGIFNPILARFAADIERRATETVPVNTTRGAA